MKEGLPQVLTLFKSARTYRVIPSLMVLLVAISLAGTTSPAIFIFGICLILTYSAFGIYNAYYDKDFLLENKCKYFIFTLLFISILISLQNKIIFASISVLTILGFIYHHTRKFLFFDNTILGLTHFAIPLFTSLLLLNQELFFSIKISSLLFGFFWFFSPIKNIKGISEDKKRKYKTLPTKFQNGKMITKIFFVISFLFIILFYFVFDLNFKFFLVIILLFVLYLIVIKNIEGKPKKTLGIVRLILIILLFGLIIQGEYQSLIYWITGLFGIYFILFIIQIRRIKNE